MSISRTRQFTAAAIIALAMLSAFAGAGPALAGVATGETAFKKGDFLTAAREFQGPAHRGDPVAQYYLGVIYADGLGGDQSLEDGLGWLMCAQTGAGLAQTLKQDAKKRRRNLMSRLSSHAMEQAKLRAAAICGKTTGASKPQALATGKGAPRPQAYASGTGTPRSQAYASGTGEPKSQAYASGTGAPRPQAYATEIAESRPQAYATAVTEPRPQAFTTEEDTIEDLLKYVSPPRGVFGTLFFFPGDTMVYGAAVVFDAMGFIVLRNIFVGMIKLMGDLIFGLLSLIGWILIGKFVYFFLQPLGQAIFARNRASGGGSMGGPA